MHVCGWQCLVLHIMCCALLITMEDLSLSGQRQRRSRLRGEGVHKRGVRGGGRGKQGKKRKEKTIWCLLNNAGGGR